MGTKLNLSRREFINSASMLALGIVIGPKISSSSDAKQGYVIVNGWVLKTSEVA
jgi:hypothetical protein